MQIFRLYRVRNGGEETHEGVFATVDGAKAAAQASQGETLDWSRPFYRDIIIAYVSGGMGDWWIATETLKS